MNKDKVLFLFLSVLFLGTVSVFAGNVFVGESGIQASYSSEDGSEGMTQNVSYKGGDDNTYYFIIKDGLIVNTTQSLDGEISNSSWWDEDWSKRKGIMITETSETTLTNYSVLLNVSYESDMQVDFDDLRFVYNEEELNYYLDSKADSSWANVYVRIPLLEASDEIVVDMYYGNSVITSLSNPEATFIIYNLTTVYCDTNENDKIREQYIINSDSYVSINYKAFKVNQYTGSNTRIKVDGTQIGNNFNPSGYLGYEVAPTIYTMLSSGDVFTLRTDDDADTGIYVRNLIVKTYASSEPAISFGVAE